MIQIAMDVCWERHGEKRQRKYDFVQWQKTDGRSNTDMLYRQIERPTDRQTDRQTNKQTDTQTD